MSAIELFLTGLVIAASDRWSVRGLVGDDVFLPAFFGFEDLANEAGWTWGLA